jgi:hypothetical protein
MDISALDVSYVAVGILTTALAILVSKYRMFKSFLWFAEKVLTDLMAIVRELKEVVSTLNDALEDDSISREETKQIIAQVNDLVDKMKMIISLEIGDECQDCEE